MEIDINAPQHLAMGYVRNDAVTARVKATIAGAVGITNGIAGATRAKIATGVHYWNLTAFMADLFAPGEVLTSRRNVIDCGADGKVLEPLGQETGICDGCSFGEAAFVAWCAQWGLSRTGERPREVTFIWPYLAGRDLSLISPGDSGAMPPLSAQVYHDLGVLPVDGGGPIDFRSLPPHGPQSQESYCVQMRDNPRLLKEWQSSAANYKCRVYSPGNAWDVADCLSTGRPVTFGSSYQARETVPGGNGISPLYVLRDGWGRPAGHETFASGWFTLGSRLGFIKTESWWNALYPASRWPNHRVAIQTDDGPRVLYPGQCAIWADEWMAGNPECWAIDAPGSR